ncbi:MAG TPA: PDZ domain-containing protein [Fimbriimonadaceae bacterium]|nr:PDZ domain-containing protein [Fimbriimonadaceae bacterium]
MAAKLALPAVLLCSVHPGISDAYESTQLSSIEQQVWKGVQPSILIISQGGVTRGSAACIDASGLYLAHQNSVQNGAIDGVTFAGQTYTLHLVARDKPTGLILLQVDSAQAPKCPVVRVADEDHARRGTLIAVLSTGPVRADISHPNIVGSYAATNQSVLFNEIRFAAPSQMLTGALLFDDRGNLVGVLGATLPKPQSVAKIALNGKARDFVGDAATGQARAGGGNANTANPPSNPPQGAAGGGGFGAGGQATQTSPQAQNTSNLASKLSIAGPADLNIAYAVSPLLLDRVVTGFLSPTHEVLHPALGAVCSDEIVNGVSQGAVIRRITPGSGAAKAGIKVGDVILNIDGNEIHNVIDYARVMLAQSVGHRVTLAIRRGSETVPIDAVVGRATDPSQLQQEISQGKQ